MTDPNAAMKGTTPLPDDDAINIDALTCWMVEHIPGFEGPIALARFKGGQSNPTYRVDTTQQRYVLRRQPFGKLLPSAHAVDREYRLIAALHPTGFPVPRSFEPVRGCQRHRLDVLCDGNGRGAFAMGRVAAVHDAR